MEIEIRACPYLDAKEVQRVLRAELRVEVALAHGAHATRVVAACAGEKLVIEVDDPLSRKVSRRNFALQSPHHPGMSRLVGIAAAELVLASWAELALNPAPSVEPEGPPPSPEAVRAVRDRVRTAPKSRPASPPPPAPETSPAATTSNEPELDVANDDDERVRESRRRGSDLRVLALGSRRAFFNHEGALYGGGARVGAEPLPFTSWAADLLVEAGDVGSGENRYSVDAWTVGGQLFLYTRASQLTARVGVGLRAGVTGTSPLGDAVGAGTRSLAPWGWPTLVTAHSLALRPVVLELSAEASYVALPVSTGRRGDTLSGVWFSLQLGLGYLP